VIHIALPAKVVHIMGKSGAKGVSRVRCKIIDESKKDKVLIRNVMGSVRVGDVLMIQESEMETADLIN